MSSSYIKDFWENQAMKYRQSHVASWGDNFAIDLEIKNIANYIKEGDHVLDVGSANGFSTFKQIQNNPASITGVDFSESMIKYANEALALHPEKEKISFKVADIRNLPFDDNLFDVVYTTRVVINLPSWEEQIKSIQECIRVTKKGGTLIISEAFWEPMVLLNSLRQLKQLKPLIEHDFNRYIKKEKLELFLNENAFSFSCNDFSSIYYLGSRFIRELVTNPAKYPGYSNPINNYFYDLELEFSGGGFGIQQAYIIKNKT